MSKKYYKKSTPKKKTKKIPICEDCLSDPTDSDLKPSDFFWILRHNPEAPSMDYYSLSCINCIEKHGYDIQKPYQKKRGRKKKEE